MDSTHTQIITPQPIYDITRKIGYIGRAVGRAMEGVKGGGEGANNASDTHLPLTEPGVRILTRARCEYLETFARGIQAS